jgi:hypothetical protein
LSAWHEIDKETKNMDAIEEMTGICSTGSDPGYATVEQKSRQLEGWRL